MANFFKKILWVTVFGAVFTFGAVLVLRLTGVVPAKHGAFDPEVSRIPWGTVQHLRGVPYMKVKGGWQKIHYD